MPPLEYDAFISYASEDRAAVSLPLARQLEALGLKIWFDQTALTIGEDLRRSIDKGLAASTCGIVILSPHFFAKEWPQKELSALFALEGEKRRVIFPVWHNLTSVDVARYSPLLAGRLAVSTDEGIPSIAQKLCLAIASIAQPGTESDGLRHAVALLERLTSCPECKVRVSKTAELCPSCGYRLLGRQLLVHCPYCKIDVQRLPMRDTELIMCSICHRTIKRTHWACLWALLFYMAVSWLGWLVLRIVGVL